MAKDGKEAGKCVQSLTPKSMIGKQSGPFHKQPNCSLVVIDMVQVPTHAMAFFTSWIPWAVERKERKSGLLLVRGSDVIISTE